MPHNPKHPLSVLTKLALDQVIMAPLGTFVFYVSVTTMAGSPEKVSSELEQKLIPTVISSYKIWPVAHLINFAVIPSQLRILYISGVTVSNLRTFKLCQVPCYSCAICMNFAEFPPGLIQEFVGHG